MEIKNFDRSIRVGSGFPACFDISRIGSHESYGVFASFFYNSRIHLRSEEATRAELRHKGNYYALFVFNRKDMDLPDWWKDSEIVWELQS